MRLAILDVVLFVLVVVLMVAILVSRLQSMFVCPMMPRMDLVDLHPRTGDLVFVNAHVGVSMFTSAWTHVGMVIGDGVQAQLLEITPVTGRPTCTPLQRRLRAVLTDCDSAVSVRAVRRKVGWLRTADAVARIRGLCYAHTYWSVWLNHVLGWVVPVPQDRPGGTYCSDLVCRLAAHMGLVHHEHVLPADMVDDKWHGDVWGPATRLVRGTCS